MKTKINSPPTSLSQIVPTLDLAWGRESRAREWVLETGTFLVKSFATKFTDKWFVAGVYSRVRVQGRAPVKSFAALVALVWLFLEGNKHQVTACWPSCGVCVLFCGVYERVSGVCV